VLTVGLPALTPTVLLKAACATLATNIGGINNCNRYNLGHLQGHYAESFLFYDTGYWSTPGEYWAEKSAHTHYLLCAHAFVHSYYCVCVCMHMQTHTLFNLTYIYALILVTTIILD
jgi:hypothetical protein